MATPLSDEIRALITYANEKTQAGDTTLGGAVKTLCDGFGGGGNVPSSPFPVPRGPLSSRLAALLTYANETTGAGDTSIGDAVRALVDGYGAGTKELVFYDKLVTDGTAVIQTDYVATLNTVGLYLDGYMSEFTPNAHFLGSTASSSASGSSCRIYVSGSTNTAYRKYAYGKIMTGSNPYALLPTGTVISDLKIRVTIDEAGNHNVWAESGGQTGENSYTYTRSNLGSVPLAIFALNYQSQDYRNNLPAGSYIRKVEIEDTELGTLTYVPCTYGGEPGMWCLQKNEFYGNAAGSGAFSVDGRIGKALLFDQLISDGTAYIATDYIPGANFKRLNLDFVGLTQYNNILGTRNFATSNNAFAITVGSLNRTATYSIFSRNNVNYNYGALAELGWNVLIEESGANYNVSTTRVGGSPSLETVAKATNYPSNPLYVFGINDGASVTPCNAGTIIRRLEIEDGDIRLDLRPCYYDGQYGMWDTISERFYGNANPAGGTFTAEND